MQYAKQRDHLEHGTLMFAALLDTRDRRMNADRFKVIRGS